jgi:hypothetical protein
MVIIPIEISERTFMARMSSKRRPAPSATAVDRLKYQPLPWNDVFEGKRQGEKTHLSSRSRNQANFPPT